jgi:hypothetical protein
MPAKPRTAATIPPMSIQIALSVGDPVKNRDTSELNEFVAVIPNMIRITPPASRAKESILFISNFYFLLTDTKIDHSSSGWTSRQPLAARLNSTVALRRDFVAQPLAGLLKALFN